MKIVCAFQDAPSQLGEAQQKWKLKQELLTHPSIADGPWVRVLQRKEEAATDELLLLLLLTDANCSFHLPQLPQHLSSTNWRGPLKKALNTYTYVKMGNNETSQAKNTKKNPPTSLHSSFILYCNELFSILSPSLVVFPLWSNVDQWARY